MATTDDITNTDASANTHASTNTDASTNTEDETPDAEALDAATTNDWHAHREREAQMTVETVRAEADHALVRVDGELDMGTAAPLWAVLRSHLSTGRRFLRLDVHGLRFLDATALSGIVAVHRDALDARGTLILTGVQSVVGRVLSLTGLDDVLFIGGPRADYDVDLRDITFGDTAFTYTDLGSDAGHGLIGAV